MSERRIVTSEEFDNLIQTNSNSRTFGKCFVTVEDSTERAQLQRAYLEYKLLINVKLNPALLKNSGYNTTSKSALQSIGDDAIDESSNGGEAMNIPDMETHFLNLNSLMRVHFQDSSTESFAAKCTGACKDLVSNCWNNEYLSMSFFLRYLSSCCVHTGAKEDRVLVTIQRWHSNWKQCQFKISFPLPKNPPRVVVGVGPSGCGKSTVAKPIFRMFNLDLVIAIDGGNSRESSITWFIAKMATNGIGNLNQIFKEHEIKLKLYKILTAPENTQSYHKITRAGRCSIYIADTLSSQLNFRENAFAQAWGKNNSLAYSQVDPNFICALIWQHKNCSDEYCSGKTDRRCPFAFPYNCVGCDRSGATRAIGEGKKYDSKAYEKSMNIGYDLLVNSPVKIMIHNTGYWQGAIQGRKSIFLTEGNLPAFHGIDGNNYVRKEIVFPTVGRGLGTDFSKSGALAGFGVFLGNGLLRALDVFQKIAANDKIAARVGRIWSHTFKKRGWFGGNKTKKVCPGIEPGLLDSKSRVINH